jgi:hypothetical protein
MLCALHSTEKQRVDNPAKQCPTIDCRQKTILFTPSLQPVLMNDDKQTIRNTHSTTTAAMLQRLSVTSLRNAEP